MQVAALKLTVKEKQKGIRLSISSRKIKIFKKELLIQLFNIQCDSRHLTDLPAWHFTDVKTLGGIKMF